MNPISILRCAISVALMTAVLAAPSTAQDPGAPRDTLRADLTPEQINQFDVVPPRDGSMIEQNRNSARQVKSEIEGQISALKMAESSAKSRVDIKKATIDVTKAQIEAAKKEKDEPAKLRLESLKKRQEVEQKFLERLADLHSLALQRAEKIRDMAQEREKALEMEVLLAERREALRVVPAGDPAAVGKEREMRDAERRVLDAMGKVADAEREVASKEKEIADRKISLFDVIKEYRQLP